MINYSSYSIAALLRLPLPLHDDRRNYVSTRSGAMGKSMISASQRLDPASAIVNDVWTTGPILKAVNRVSLYKDSKTFV